jgi:hypothetical protein
VRFCVGRSQKTTTTTDANEIGIVDFETFSKILNRPGGFREPFDIEEYIRGFQVFDKDRSGFVGKGQIKYILTNLGEKMSEEEVDELFKSTIDASNDEVDYRGTFGSGTGHRTCVLEGHADNVIYRVRQDDCGELGCARGSLDGSCSLFYDSLGSGTCAGHGFACGIGVGMLCGQSVTTGGNVHIRSMGVR